MPRNQGPPADDPFYRRTPARGDMFADDALPLDDGDEVEEEPKFRRGGKRVPVRRGALQRKTAARVRNVLVIVLLLSSLGAAVYFARDFALHSERFLLRDESAIELQGAAPNSRAQILKVMHQSVGRSLFQISLNERKRELERIPWVQSATVIRLWPACLRVEVRERTPVAVVAFGEQTMLIDESGVLMELPTTARADYSFPVILGMSESEPLSTRAARMKTYMRLIRELDGGEGAKTQYSQAISEVDLSDPDNVKISAHGGQGDVLVDLGNSDFLSKFMRFRANVQKWEQERGKLESVDLRYSGQVILNPESHAAAPPPAPKPEAKAEAKSAAVAPRHTVGGAAHHAEKKRK